MFSPRPRLVFGLLCAGALLGTAPTVTARTVTAHRLAEVEENATSAASAPTVNVDPSGEITAETGDLRVVLSDLQTGLSPRDLRSPVGRNEVPWARMAVRITQGEQPTSDWGLASIAIPQGKGWRAGKCVTRFTAPGEGYFAFPAPPAGMKAPWKTRIEVARAPRGVTPDFTRGFAPAELWTLPGLPIPTRRSYTRLPKRSTATSKANGAVKLLAVAGPGTQPPNGLMHRDPVPSVQFCIDPGEPDLRVTLLRATDFNNRIVPLTGEVEGRTVAGRIQALGLRPNRKSRVLNLVVAVQHARRFETNLSPTK